MEPLDAVAKLDLSREARTGIPEVVLAEGKTDADLARIVRAFVAIRGRVLVSRLAPERLAVLAGEDLKLDYSERARLLVASNGRTETPRTGGRIAVLAAGTADVAVAEEARLVAQALGCETETHYDVGVAGIHRLFPALDAASGADVYVVCAGREGALATVVAGLVDKPVIGVPVSVGYGHLGAGEAALGAMLQSCAPLTVVNIDAGVVAGLCAAQIANTIARARTRAQSPAIGRITP